MIDPTQVLLTPQIMMLSAGIVAILWAIGMVPTSEAKRVGQHWAWRKVLPIAPIALGIGGAFIPGVVCDDCQWGTLIIAGAWAGFIAAHGRKVIKRLAVDKLRDVEKEA